jgi:hydroxyacylglutathione hydrolase
VLFRQFVDDDLGCASYLIGSTDAGEAVVVDPAYAIEQYVQEAGRNALRITRVVETHNHADHVSGHGRLAVEQGARVSIHPLAEPQYDFDPIEDGDQLAVGEATLRVLHTPGHRPEHCAFLVDSRLLTGDSLFVGDAARPDLAVGAAEGAEGLFHSLRRLDELPDDVEVYPAHVAGSLCGAALSPDHSSTLGRERLQNRALRIAELDEFVADALSKSAPRPPNMDRIVALNRGPFLGPPPPLERLDDPGGPTVLDVRAAAEFARGHLRGAFNVPFDGSSFATRSAFVVGEGPVVVQASSAEQAETAARGLRAVGILDLAGYVVDPSGMEATLEPVDLDELDRLLEEGAVELLDVRETDERDAAYIAGSRHIPYRLLPALSDGVGNLPVVTICTSGTRAAIAASVLAARGIDARPVLDGGVPDWQARGGRTIEFRRCGS